MPDNNAYSIKSIDLQNNISSKIVFDFTTKNYKKLLQELYIILLNINISCDIENQLNEIINNFLFEYDLDPKNLFEIMISNSQNICYYSSLIGFFYQQGIGCETDKVKAFEIFSDTFNAIKNKTESDLDQKNEIDYDIKKLNEMISLYFYSLFLYKDVISHRRNNYKLHIKNAEKGDHVSQYYVGNCYRYGINIKYDYNKAVEWYSKSSTKGENIKAMYSLGYCYDDRDKNKAFELYLKSAEGGYKCALYMVGTFYYYGNYGNGILRDENKAFEWYLKAAKKGHAHSQYLVAKYYNDGKYIPKNEEKGIYWCRKAAINGYIDAQYNLALYYSINKNERKAFIWYLKLANKKSQRAIYIVAKYYRDGIGTDRNSKEATKWFNQFESMKFYRTSLITLKEFLNGSNINVFELFNS